MHRICWAVFQGRIESDVLAGGRVLRNLSVLISIGLPSDNIDQRGADRKGNIRQRNCPRIRERDTEKGRCPGRGQDSRGDEAGKG